MMGSPHRLMILCTLLDGEHSVGQLVELLDLPQSIVSQQLAVLRQESLVQTRREAQTIFYSLDSGEVQQVTECLHRIYCA